MHEDQIQAFLDEVGDGFQKLKIQAERAAGQVDDNQFFALLDEESNSIALIIKHMAGNMKSRWTDFLTSDGEKPDRMRDQEFIIFPQDTRPYIMAQWETGWQLVFSAIVSVSPQNFNTTVYIRGEAHSILQAIHRQMIHYAYHVGQIVQLARYHAGPRWTPLSIPRGQSAAFNKAMFRSQK